MTKGSKKKFAKKHSPLTLDRLYGPFGLLLGSFGFVILAAFLYVWTFNLEPYRDLIIEALETQTGRAVHVDGAIKWNFSLSQGLRVGLEDVSIANPPWGSRPMMAQIDRLGLRVSGWRLLARRLEIVSVNVKGAQVQLERGPNGAANWVFTPKSPTAKEEDYTYFKDVPKKEKPTELPPIDLDIHKVSVEQSRFGVMTDEGSLAIFELPALAFEATESGLHAHFKGSWASLPVELDVAGGSFASLNDAEWPFNMQGVYAGMLIDAKGHLTDHMKKIAVDSFKAAAGETALIGKMEIELEKERPSFKGVIASEHFSLGDLNWHEQGLLGVQTFLADVKSAVPNGRLFSRRVIATDKLRLFDTDIRLKMNDVILGLTPLHNLETRLTLTDGFLQLAPFAVDMAGSRVEGLVKVDARGEEAQVTAALAGRNLEFSKLLDLGGVESMITGKVDLDLNLKTAGRSSYDFASHANGHVNLLMDTGTFSTSGLQTVIGGLADFFLPGASTLVSPGIHCMAARYDVKNGFVETNGLLIDLDSTTMAGTGTINLPDEHMNIDLQTRPKGVGVAAIVPPMRIYGSLLSPSVSFDTNSLLRKIQGILTLSKGLKERVPSMLHVDGQNDCAVTLDNLALAYHQDGNDLMPLVSDETTLLDNLKQYGGQILQGIGDKFFSN